MGNLFNKKTQHPRNSGEGRKDLVASSIAGSIKKVQQGWANWMDKRSRRMSPRSRWIAFVLFIAITAAASIYVLLSALTHRERARIVSIKVPVQLRSTVQRLPMISASEYQKLKQYRLYIDSLGRSPAGKDQYRQFRSRHSGLLDSIRTIEKMYQSQLNQ